MAACKGNIFAETAKTVQELARKHRAILVAYSGGKDSLAITELCCRAFDRVELFHMERLPGLRCIEERLEYAHERWGLIVRRYPHWALAHSLKSGAYCNSHWSRQEWLDFKLGDIHEVIREDTGIQLIAHGGRWNDGQWRRRQMGTERSDNRGVVYPIKYWNKWDVLAFLATAGIPAPPSPAGRATGPGNLNTVSLLWLHDTYPDDFERLCWYFPYARAVVCRRDWYGVGKT